MSEGDAITVKTIDVTKLRVMDLMSLECTRMRIKGMSYYVTDEERIAHGGTEYLLVREHDNAYDSKAVAVYSHRGRKMGFLAASMAAHLTPLLDQLSVGAFLIGGAMVDGRYPRIDVPKTSALRVVVRDWTR